MFLERGPRPHNPQAVKTGFFLQQRGRMQSMEAAMGSLQDGVGLQLTTLLALGSEWGPGEQWSRSRKQERARARCGLPGLPKAAADNS